MQRVSHCLLNQHLLPLSSHLASQPASQSHWIIVRVDCELSRSHPANILCTAATQPRTLYADDFSTLLLCPLLMMTEPFPWLFVLQIIIITIIIRSILRRPLNPWPEWTRTRAQWSWMTPRMIRELFCRWTPIMTRQEDDDKVTQI